ncbi:MAG: FlgD immunoglobulin-like domain containing protein, partial [Candidatus Omnitrophica bacterium]|nr:FlgD immunoglobulin-like domain containing protein [Candidatus Omnitrophota bacterium]
MAIMRRIAFLSVVILLNSLVVPALWAQPTAGILLTVTVNSAEVPPAAPEGLTAVVGDTAVDLTWQPNQESDLAGYNVYRSQTSGSGYVKVNSELITPEEYRDTGLTNGITYYYVVTAVDANTHESVYSSEQEATPGCWITSISCVPNAFSPNDDGAYDSVVVRYVLGQGSMVSVTILDGSGGSVRILKSGLAEPAGTYEVSWDGKDSSGTVLADGEYFCRIAAQSSSGLQSQATGTVAVDNHGIKIINPPENTALFVGDSATITAVFSVYTHEVSNVQFYYCPLGGTEWDNIPDPVTQVSANTWQMFSEEVKGTPGDQFLIRVSGQYRDLNGQIRTEYSAPVQYSFSTAATIANIAVTPNAFSPNNDQAYDTATISYELINSAAAVSVDIYNSSNVLVKSLENKSAKEPGGYSAEWDGTDSGNSMVPDGEYKVKITAEDGEGSVYEKNAIVVIDTHFMTITEPANGAVLSIGENFVFRAVPSAYTANVANVYFQLLPHGSPDWITIDDNISRVSDGSWICTGTVEDVVPGTVFDLRVKADYSDLNGQARTEQSAVIELSVSDAFNLFNVVDAPDAFSPNGDGNYDSVTIGYVINKNSSIGITIYDENNVSVRALQNAAVEFAGSYSVAWDGKNDGGVVASDGVYRYCINADDGMGNTVQKQGTVTLDNHGIVFSEPAGGAVLSGQVTFKAIVSANMQDAGNVLFYAREKGQMEWELIDDDNPPVEQADGSWAQTVDTLSGALNTTYEFAASVDFRDFNDENRREYSLPIECSIQNEITLTNVKDRPDAFSPNADGQCDTSVIEYRLNIAAPVTIKIYDSNNALVRTLQNAVTAPIGDNVVIWDGSDDSNAVLPDDSYRYEITAVDTQSGKSAAAQGTVVIDNHFMRVIEPSAGSTITHDVQIKVQPSPYIADEQSVGLFYRLKGESGWNVMPGTAQKQADGAWKLVWNVDALAIGQYEVRVSAVYNDVDGKQRQEYSPVLEYTVPDCVKITNVSDAPDAFSPDGDGQYDTDLISFELSNDATVSVSIVNQDNVLVRALKNSIVMAQGANTVEWDGRDNSGTICPDNTYKYVIRAVNNGGYVSEQERAVTVDNHVVLITVPAPASTVTGQVTLTAIASSTVKYPSLFKFLYRRINQATWEGFFYGQWNDSNRSWTAIWDTPQCINGEYEIACSFEYEDLNQQYRDETTAILATCTVNNGINILNVSDSPDSFSPNANGEFDTATIQYELINYSGNVSVKVYNNLNEQVRILKEAVMENPGSYQVVWDGKDDTRQVMPDGVYHYVIDVNDGNGNVIEKQGTITLDNHYVDIIYPGGSDLVSGTVTVRAIPSAFCQRVTSVVFSIRHTTLGQYYMSQEAVLQEDGSWIFPWDSAMFPDGECLLQATISYRDLNDFGRNEKLEKHCHVLNNKIIFNVSDTPDPFSPNADGKYDATNFYYTVSDDITLTISIVDAQSNLIRVLKNSERVGPCLNQMIIWDGKDDAGNTVEEGMYACVFKAEHSPENYEIYKNPVAVDSHPARIVEPVPDSCVSGIVTLRISPSVYIKQVKRVKIRVDSRDVGSAMNENDGTWSFDWDASVLSNGYHNVLVNIDYLDSNNSYRTEWISAASFFVANNLLISRNAFSPNGDGYSDTTAMSYFMAFDGNITAVVKNGIGAIVRSLKENEFHNAGQQSIVWDGKDDSGSILADGDYTYVIDADFGAGNYYHQQAT